MGERYQCQEPYSSEFGGGLGLGGNASVGEKRNGSPDWGDLQGGISILPGGVWIGHFSTHEF
jgi:hypothetical protein